MLALVALALAALLGLRPLLFNTGVPRIYRIKDQLLAGLFLYLQLLVDDFQSSVRLLTLLNRSWHLSIELCLQFLAGLLGLGRLDVFLLDARLD